MKFRQVLQGKSQIIDTPNDCLCGNVYNNDPNRGIVVENALNINRRVRNGIYKATKDYLENKNKEIMPKELWGGGNFDERGHGVYKAETPLGGGEHRIDIELHEFWSRYQYEMGLTSKFAQDDPKSAPFEATDIYSQIQMNGEHFIKYLKKNMSKIMEEFAPEEENE